VSGITANAQTVVAGVSYMPFGMAAGWMAGNGASYRRTFDLDGRTIGLTLPASDTIALTYDAASRITSMTESGLPTKTFSYDALDRLKEYMTGAAAQTFGYDANGNRTSFSSNGTSPVALSYNYDTSSNRLLSISGGSRESFTYDAAGNMLSYSAPFADYSFTYDARNRRTASYVGAIGTTDLINGLGQRVAQSLGGAPQFFFAYDEAGHLIGRYNGNGVVVEETVWLGDLPVGVLHSSGGFAIAPDHLGTPHQITNASGQAVWLWDHDPFGNGDPSGTLTYNLRFPGQFYDRNTKLHYNYFRDYDPRKGRYIESDPIGLAGGINTYAYAGGNPIRSADFNGTSITTGSELAGAALRAGQGSPIGKREGKFRSYDCSDDPGYCPAVPSKRRTHYGQGSRPCMLEMIDNLRKDDSLWFRFSVPEEAPAPSPTPPILSRP
jgi:RHS repeat-associated protein